jgi:hypothetical protein
MRHLTVVKNPFCYRMHQKLRRCNWDIIKTEVLNPQNVIGQPVVRRAIGKLQPALTYMSRRMGRGGHITDSSGYWVVPSPSPGGI